VWPVLASAAMSPEKRLTARQVAAGQTRRKLLAAALAEFARRPYADVTVGEIARSAGVAHGLLSHHFQGKQGIYLAAVTEVYRQLREAQESDPSASPRERIRQHLHGHLTFMAEHADMALNMVLGNAGGEVFSGLRWRGLRELCELIGLDADNQAVGVVMRAFSAGVDELTANWLRLGRPFEVAPVVEVARTFLEGAVRGAHQLDPGLDVRAALTALGQ
jgi:AcrR family transcriptional regulator